MKTGIRPASAVEPLLKADALKADAPKTNAHNQKQAVGSADVALRLMETMPYIMYYLRSNILRQAETPASLPQLRAMSFIYNCPGSSLSRLAESIGVANATASTMVERLVKAGMVLRVNDPISRRNVVLSLSEAGVEHLLATRSVTQQELTRVIDHLPTEKLESMEEALTLLKGVFTQANAKI